MRQRSCEDLSPDGILKALVDHDWCSVAKYFGPVINTNLNILFNQQGLPRISLGTLSLCSLPEPNGLKSQLTSHVRVVGDHLGFVNTFPVNILFVSALSTDMSQTVKGSSGFPNWRSLRVCSHIVWMFLKCSPNPLGLTAVTTSWPNSALMSTCGRYISAHKSIFTTCYPGRAIAAWTQWPYRL